MNQNQYEFQTRIAGGPTCSPPKGECRHRQSLDRTDTSMWSAGVVRGASPWLIVVGGTVVWSDAPIAGGGVVRATRERLLSTFSHPGQSARGRRPTGGTSLATPSWGGETTYSTQNNRFNDPLLHPRRTTGGSSKGSGGRTTKGSGKIEGKLSWTRRNSCWKKQSSVLLRTMQQQQIRSSHQRGDSRIHHLCITSGSPTTHQPITFECDQGRIHQRHGVWIFYNQFPLSP